MLLRSCLLALPVMLSTALPSGSPEGPVPDLTFPDFDNGDGRQKLHNFRGSALLVVTFADVYGGTAASNIALKLHEEFAEKGLIVVLTHFKGGGTFADAAAGKKLGAWAMKRYPGQAVRLCGRIRPTWDWTGLGMTPYYAVIGADGKLVATGATLANPKLLEEAVEEAMKLQRTGWGNEREKEIRAQLYGKRKLGAAWKESGGLLANEIDAEFARRKAAIAWLIDDGQWLHAQGQAESLAKSVAGVEKWGQEVAGILEGFETEAAERELKLDAKLQRLLKSFAKKAPKKGADRGLRKLAEGSQGTKVGARAKRLAEWVSEAAEI